MFTGENMKDIDQITADADEINTKTKIFNVAARLIGQKGYHAVSMREISEQSGVSKPTIYYYFKSKEGLYRQLFISAIAYSDDQLNEILTRNISVKEKLIELIKVRFHQALRYPELAKFFLHLFIFMEDTPLSAQFQAEAIIRREILSKLIQEGINNKEFGLSAKTPIAVEIILGTLIYFISQQLVSHKKILSDQLAEEITEVLFKGLNE
jgi:TetR/AcrR family fatty acid metabolism transcriptional regulator